MTCLLFRRELVSRIGYFRTDRASVADLEWSMRAILASDLAYVPGRLATWRIREGQGTGLWSEFNLARTHLACINSVVNDPDSGIPEAWKAQDDWRNLLTTVYRMDYLDALGLFRSVANKSPRQFMNNVLRALHFEPAFLFQQALRGFAWSPQFSPDKAQIATRLLQLFQAQWPPRTIQGGW
jgi:hypothetical protein